MNLLKELSRGEQQANLKSADSTDAGSSDTGKKVDVGFSLMRNMINRETDVTGSDVNDYLERAQDLNDEVDTVGFAVETDTGELIKIYVAAAQAQEFEEAMSKMLGLDSDSESAINTLAQKFDIVDVIWPTHPTPTDVMNPDSELSIDDSSLLDDPSNPEAPTTPPDVDNPDSSIDGVDGVDGFDAPDEEDTDKDDKKKKSLMKDIDTEADKKDKKKADDKEEDVDIDAEVDDSEEDDENEAEEPELDDDGNPLVDDDGEPVMKKKKKKAKKDDESKAEDSPADPVDKEIKTEEGLTRLGKLAENAREEITAHVAAAQERGVHGKWCIAATVTGGSRGRLQFEVKKAGSVLYFDDETQAMQEAEKLTKARNVAGAKAHFSYTPKLVEAEIMNTELAEWKSKSAPSTVGAGFLNRIMEAEETVRLDGSWKGIASHLKRPYDKKIVALFQAVGISGRIAASTDEDIIASIQAGGDLIRRAGKRQSLFDTFLSQMGGTVSASPVEEAKKRGGRLQKTLETVMIKLGLPAVLATGTKASSAFSRATVKIEGNPDIEKTLISLSRALGIKADEINEGVLVEAFSALEALTSSDLKHFNAVEPNAGPAMMASYEGGGSHEETIMMLAVDPDADDEAKSLRVGIDGPWDGTLHNKYFPNNKDGYKAALDYANMLRTANLKTGGRPK